MIYTVNFDRIALALTEGATIICMSADSSKALMSHDKILSTEFISEYSDDERGNILSLEEWHQPCKDC